MRLPFLGRRAISVTSSKFYHARRLVIFHFIHSLGKGPENLLSVFLVVIILSNLTRAPEKEEESDSGKKKEGKCAAPESFEGCFQLSEGDDWVCRVERKLLRYGLSIVLIFALRVP